ncbi:MAG: hypothetical protein E7354_02075 [Clostridiales bacterium]|nr:hypothetical protein [Clostridiales bacterium]
MKFWVKIVVALSVVVVAGFAVWAFFFKENDESIAFNRMSELVDYKQSLGLKERLLDLEDYNYLSQDESKVISSDSTDGKKIYSLRELCLSEDAIVLYDENHEITATYGSYMTYENKVDEIFEYLLPHLNGTRVTAKTRKAVTNAISDYIDSLKAVSEALDMLIVCQDSITGTATEMTVLANNYGELRLRYRESLDKAGEVITAAIKYVNISVYDNGFKADTRFALYDCFGIALSAATDSELKIIQEPDFSNDVYTILTKINQFDAGTSIFTAEYSEYDFLTNYNKLLWSHHGVLESVLKEPYIVKRKMADNSNLSGVVESAQPAIVTVLNILGF